MAIVEKQSAYANSAAASVSLSLGAIPSAGNYLLLAIMGSPAGTAISGWTTVANSQTTYSFVTIYSRIIGANPTTADQSVTFAGTAGYDSQALLVEAAGVNTSVAPIVSITDQPYTYTSKTLPTANITVAANSTVLVGFSFYAPGAYTPAGSYISNGYTLDRETNSEISPSAGLDVIWGHAIVASAGTTTATAGFGGNPASANSTQTSFILALTAAPIVNHPIAPASNAAPYVVQTNAGSPTSGGSATTTLTATLPKPPTLGNMLLFGVATPSPSLPISIAGATQIAPSVYSSVNGSTTNMSVFALPVTSTVNSFVVSLTTANFCSVTIVEVGNCSQAIPTSAAIGTASTTTGTALLTTAAVTPSVLSMLPLAFFSSTFPTTITPTSRWSALVNDTSQVRQQNYVEVTGISQDLTTAIAAGITTSSTGILAGLIVLLAAVGEVRGAFTDAAAVTNSHGLPPIDTRAPFSDVGASIKLAHYVAPIADTRAAASDAPAISDIKNSQLHTVPVTDTRAAASDSPALSLTRSLMPTDQRIGLGDSALIGPSRIVAPTDARAPFSDSPAVADSPYVGTTQSIVERQRAYSVTSANLSPSIILGAAPTPGNLLLLVVVGFQNDTPPAGFTQISYFDATNTNVIAWYRVVSPNNQPGDGPTVTFGASTDYDCGAVFVEIANVDPTTLSLEASDVTYSANAMSTPSLSYAAGQYALAIFAPSIGTAAYTASGTTVSGGYAIDRESVSQGTANGASFLFTHQVPGATNFGSATATFPALSIASGPQLQAVIQASPVGTLVDVALATDTRSPISDTPGVVTTHRPTVFDSSPSKSDSPVIGLTRHITPQAYSTPAVVQTNATLLASGSLGTSLIRVSLPAPPTVGNLVLVSVATAVGSTPSIASGALIAPTVTSTIGTTSTALSVFALPITTAVLASYSVNSAFTVTLNNPSFVTVELVEVTGCAPVTPTIYGAGALTSAASTLKTAAVVPTLPTMLPLAFFSNAIPSTLTTAPNWTGLVDDSTQARQEAEIQQRSLTTDTFSPIAASITSSGTGPMAALVVLIAPTVTSVGDVRAPFFDNSPSFVASKTDFAAATETRAATTDSASLALAHTILATDTSDPKSDLPIVWNQRANSVTESQRAYSFPGAAGFGSVQLPAAPKVGNVLLLVIMGVVPTSVAGFTLIGSTTTAQHAQAAVFTRTVLPTDGNPLVSFAGSATTDDAAVLIELNNAAGYGYTVTAGNQQYTAATTSMPSGVETSTAGSYVFAGFAPYLATAAYTPGGSTLSNAFLLDKEQVSRGTTNGSTFLFGHATVASAGSYSTTATLPTLPIASGLQTAIMVSIPVAPTDAVTATDARPAFSDTALAVVRRSLALIESVRTFSDTTAVSSLHRIAVADSRTPTVDLPSVIDTAGTDSVSAVDIGPSKADAPAVVAGRNISPTDARGSFIDTPAIVHVSGVPRPISVPSGAPRVVIFNRNNVLQDIPGDVMSVTASTVVNGGPSDCTITMPRQFADIGAIGEGYRIQIYMPDDLVSPWWDGRVTQTDAQVTNSGGRIQVMGEGWHTALNDAVTTFTVTPGVQSNGQNNGQLDYGAFINWMLTTYAPPGYSVVAPSSAGVNVIGFQTNHQGVADVLDTVTKSILDASNAHWEWYVEGTASLGKQIIVQPVSAYESVPVALDQLADCNSYDIRATYRDIKNMLALYGGNDPVTGVQLWNPYSNSTSISTYGLRQTSISNNYLVSQDQLNQYAAAQLNVLAFPSFSGSWNMKVASAKIRAGRWVMVFEPSVQGFRTMRLARVTVSWSKGTYIQQTCEPNAPLVNIDKAIYDTTKTSQATGAAGAATRTGVVNLNGLSSVVSGGSILSTSSA